MTLQEQIDLVNISNLHKWKMPLFAINDDEDDFMYDVDGVPIALNAAAQDVLDRGAAKVREEAESQKTTPVPFTGSVAMTPWEYIANKNRELTKMVQHRSVGDAIMTLLYGMTVWAKDNMVDADEVDVVRAEWHNGRLVFNFQVNAERDFQMNPSDDTW